MNLDIVRGIRLYELDLVAESMPAGSSVLEIGAGVGWQANELQRRGFTVEAIDLADGTYAHLQIHPVKAYDGVTIPYPDGSFDVVFSSNVLEHIPHVEAFQAEIHRVLKPGGLAIHGMPTATWRLWTSLAHYPYLAQRLVGRHWRQPKKAIGSAIHSKEARRSSSWLAWICHALYAQRHGESGNVVTELYYFSRWRWRRLFARNGWKITGMYSNRLVYTGYAISGTLLPLAVRYWLSWLLGGSVIFYVMRPNTSDL